ncbi:polysaccharide pyruvyl transferase family protein [Echinicola sediminis]
MKIGILTFHYSINPGSVMQAYCVYKLLSNAFPEARVEIINLIPDNREKNERDFFRLKPPFVRFSKILRYNSIRNFIKKNTRLSKACSKTELNDQIDFINGLNYDYIFTGSDTVWMYSDKLSKQLPNIYFLPPQIKAQKFSISASVDPLVNVTAYLKQQETLSQVFDQYKLLFVRDTVTESLLKTMGVEKGIKIADPTLLYDFEKDFDIKLNKSENIKKKVVLIGVTDDNIAKWIKQELKNHSKEYVFINRKESLQLFDDHVLDQLSLFSQIDIIITDRFHGSVFSMKLSNSLVINVERFNKNPLPQSKGRDLFQSIGIPEYCIRLEEDNQSEFKNKLLGLIDKWDAQKFNQREALLRDFISKNQMVWKTNLKKAIQQKESVMRI